MHPVPSILGGQTHNNTTANSSEYFTFNTSLIVCLEQKGRQFDLGTAVGLKVRSPCQRLHIAVAVAINTTDRGEIRTWVLSHRHCNMQLYRHSEH